MSQVSARDEEDNHVIMQPTVWECCRKRRVFERLATTRVYLATGTIQIALTMETAPHQKITIDVR